MIKKALKALKVMLYIASWVFICDTAWAIYSLNRMNQFMETSECGNHEIETLFIKIGLTKTCE